MKKIGKMSTDRVDICRRLVAACKATGEYLDACKACGLDMDDIIAANETQLSIAEKLLERFATAED